MTIGNTFSPSDDASMKFLTESTPPATLEGFDPRQDLLDYVNNKTNDVRGKNFYKTNYNTPKFDSNLMDVQSFYNINYDNNDCNKFGFDGINLNQVSTKPLFEKFKNSNANLAAPPLHTQNISPPHSSEKWTYKNELAMNGGIQQDGVIGYSGMGDDYAPYQTGGPFQALPNIATTNDYQSCTGKTFDLRYDRQNYEP